MEFMKFLATKLQITNIDQIWLTLDKNEVLVIAYNRKVAN